MYFLIYIYDFDSPCCHTSLSQLLSLPLCVFSFTASYLNFYLSIYFHLHLFYHMLSLSVPCCLLTSYRYPLPSLYSITQPLPHQSPERFNCMDAEQMTRFCREARIQNPGAPKVKDDTMQPPDSSIGSSSCSNEGIDGFTVHNLMSTLHDMRANHR